VHPLRRLFFSVRQNSKSKTNYCVLIRDRRTYNLSCPAYRFAFFLPLYGADIARRAATFLPAPIRSERNETDYFSVCLCIERGCCDAGAKPVVFQGNRDQDAND